METAGEGVGQTGHACAHATSNHARPHGSGWDWGGEVGGRGEECDSWHPASPAGWTTTPEEGEAGGRGSLTAILQVC